MDFSEGSLFASVIVSCLGMGFFIYGKKAQRMYPLLGGIAMSIYPFFITDPLSMWLTTAGVLVVLYFLREK